MNTALQPAARRARELGARLPAELVLDRYRLCERLGSGGFGTVWRGHDERLDREVAVKRIPRGPGHDGGRADEDRRRAGREALAAARLGHPSIVALYEAGADQDSYYIVSELVHGCTLADLYAAGALSDARVLTICAELADALAHAHARGIVHRDVKPQNVIVPGAGADGDPHDSQTPGRRRPSRATVKLTDFGIARIAGSAPLTHTGDVVGTLAYMAPEQSDGRQAGPAADLYSLALVAYEGLAGHNPLRGSTPAETARRLGRPVAELRRSRRDLPAPLCEAIDRALSVDPPRRGTLAELREALSAEIETAAAEPPQRARERASHDAPASPSRLAARPRLLAAVSAALLGVAILAGVGSGASVSPWWGLIAGAAVALAPRAGWVAAATAAVAWLAFAQPGAAVLLALALIVAPALLPRSPALWSVPLLAPALGVIGAALAFPALAGQLRTAWQRAAVAVAGLWWLLLAEPLVGHRLLLGVAAGTRDRHSWEGSVGPAISHALLPLLRGGYPAVALAWALAALLLPLLAHRRRAPLAMLAASLWAGALLAATPIAVGAAAPRSAHVDSLALLPGGVAAVAAICAGWMLRRRRAARRAAASAL